MCEDHSAKVCFYGSLSREVLGPGSRVWGSKTPPAVEEDQIRDSLSKLDLHKCTAPAARVVRGPLPISLECSGQSGGLLMMREGGDTNRGRTNWSCSVLEKDDLMLSRIF